MRYTCTRARCYKYLAPVAGVGQREGSGGGGAIGAVVQKPDQLCRHAGLRHYSRWCCRIFPGTPPDKEFVVAIQT